MAEKSVGYYAYNEGDLILVFVHGYLSNSQQCWTNMDKNKFWPDLIKDDARFNEPSIYLSEFYTEVNSNDYSVQNCAEEVFGQLKRNDGSSKSPPINKKNIVFVTHSTGGIVVRYLLEAHREEFKDKNIGLALYASPSYGSKLASSLGWLAKIRNNQLAQELSWGSSILDDLDGRFRNLLDDGKLNIKGFEAFENKPPFRTSLFQSSNLRVVEKESASRYFGKPSLIPGSNHSSIVKPDTDQHHTHLKLYDFLNDKGFFIDKKNNEIGNNITSKKSVNNDEANVLFEIYKPRHDKFFVTTNDYTDISNTLDRCSIWVYGASGVGKTVAIQRAILKKGFQTKYISLSTCIHEPMDVIFNDILVSLTDKDTPSKNSSLKEILKNISSEIITYCKRDNLCLFIEEIPIKNVEEFIKFSEFIYTLLIMLKDINNFRLVLSSIFEPVDISNTELEKISERFKLIKSNKWKIDEIQELIELIEGEMSVDVSMTENADSFNGSPREVKNHYRNDIAFSTK